MAKKHMPQDEPVDTGASLALYDRREGILVEQNDAADIFSQYASARDEVLGTAYAPNRALARSGAPFTVLRAVRATKKAPDGSARAGETIETFLYLIALQAPFVSVDETTLEETDFTEGETLKLELEQLTGPRSSDFDIVEKILHDHGGRIPNLSLQEYPAQKKGRSNSYGLIDARRWRTVRDVAIERGLIREKKEE